MSPEARTSSGEREPQADESSKARPIPEKPFLKPWYRLARKDGRLVLDYAHSAVVLEGKAAEKLLPVLLPLLDGTRTVEEICAYQGEKLRPAIENALELLHENDLLTNGPPLAPDTPASIAQTSQFLAATLPDRASPAQSQEALERAQGCVLGSGAIAQEIARTLRLSGVTSTDLSSWPESRSELEQMEFAIVAPEPGELRELERWNGFAIEATLPWLQVLPFDGRMAVVGPLYVPDDTCCFECYRRRRGANLDYGMEDFWALEEVPAAYPTPPPVMQMIGGLAATLALGWLSAAERAVAPATMYAVEWGAGLDVTLHHVYRVPRCPACSEVSRQGTPSPWHD